MSSRSGASSARSSDVGRPAAGWRRSATSTVASDTRRVSESRVTAHVGRQAPPRSSPARARRGGQGVLRQPLLELPEASRGELVTGGRAEAELLDGAVDVAAVGQQDGEVVVAVDVAGGDAAAVGLLRGLVVAPARRRRGCPAAARPPARPAWRRARARSGPRPGGRSPAAGGPGRCAPPGSGRRRPAASGSSAGSSGGAPAPAGDDGGGLGVARGGDLLATSMACVAARPARAGGRPAAARPRGRRRRRRRGRRASRRRGRRGPRAPGRGCARRRARRRPARRS